MKKILMIAIAASAGVLAYVLIRKKLLNQDEEPEIRTNAAPLKHHLTSAFSNAKKHALHNN